MCSAIVDHVHDQPALRGQFQTLLFQFI